MIKYKLYTHSGVMYVVPLDKYEYIDDVLEIPLIGERKTTSGLENCSIWWD